MARGIAHREWRIDRSDYDGEAAFREAVQAELAMCENIGERLGVAIVSAPIRTRLNDGGEWFTAAWVFRTATVPGASAPKPEETPEERLHRELHDGTRSVIEPEDVEPALVEDVDLASVE